MRHRPPAPLLIGILVVAALAWWTYTAWSATRAPGPLTASGTVEADEVLLAAEVSGRLLEVPVEEGQAVKVGDLIARVDDALIQLQLTQAEVHSPRCPAIKFIRSATLGLVSRPWRSIKAIARPATK